MGRACGHIMEVITEGIMAIDRAFRLALHSVAMAMAVITAPTVMVGMVRTVMAGMVPTAMVHLVTTAVAFMLSAAVVIPGVIAN